MPQRELRRASSFTGFKSCGKVRASAGCLSALFSVLLQFLLTQHPVFGDLITHFALASLQSQHQVVALSQNALLATSDSPCNLNINIRVATGTQHVRTHTSTAQNQ